MKIAVTGATGFIGRYLRLHLTGQGHQLRCWYRRTSRLAESDRDNSQITWVPGELGDASSSRELVAGCSAVVHAALDRPGRVFRGGEGDVAAFAETNILGTIRLIEAARAASVERFVFISTCAVHEVILEDRVLDETHPLWPTSHYGAHKAALEKFVHSYGLGQGYTICALRPTGVYGMASPVQQSKWFDIVQRIVAGQSVRCRGGGKEVHALDVARAVGLLLEADTDQIAGQAYNCCDRYVSQYDIAVLAKTLSGSRSEIVGEPSSPKHQISTSKLSSLGMQFGGKPLLEETVAQLVQAAG